MGDSAIPIWVTSRTGTRIYLTNDPIDDNVAFDIFSRPDLFLPDHSGATGSSGLVLAIGGHHGILVAEAMHRYSGCNFIVVEPHPLWCDLIRKQVAANGNPSRVRIVNACLADDCSKRTLRFDHNASWGATTQAVGMGSETVETCSATLVEILSGERPGLIYCNAEGAEFSLIRQLQSSGIQPELLVIMGHPEYGDVPALRRDVQNLGYETIFDNCDAKRPIFHFRLLKK
jgi:FkbM family methyltransferase